MSSVRTEVFLQHSSRPLVTIMLLLVSILGSANAQVKSEGNTPQEKRQSVASDKPKSTKSKPEKPGPSIQWVNPPTDKHLPLPAGAAHRTFKSALAGQDVGYVIYLPPQHERQSERRFPVIYNLHGNGGNELTSLNVLPILHQQIVRGIVPPMIMVLANGGHSTFYKNSHDGRFPIESIVIQELIPHIDSTFRTIASGDARCIEGFSMGGRGATRLAVKYPEMFCSLFCQAGNVPHLLESYDQLSPQERQQYLLGPNRATWEQDDVYRLTEKNKAAIKKNLRIQIACGTQDRGHIATIRDWHHQLQSLDIDHSYIELQGLAHKRTEMINRLEPIWFRSHVEALRQTGALGASQGGRKSTQSQQVPDDLVVTRDVPYHRTTDGPQLLDAYRPKKRHNKLPVILYVHGGGWKNGDKKSGWKNAGWLVGEGYALVSINYRLTDVAAWPAQIDDCYSAVRWIRENATSFGFDKDRIVVWGSSAGGHLAAIVGTRPFPGAEKTDSRVQAMIDWFGPTDLLTMPPNVVSETRDFEAVANSNGAKLLLAPVMNVPTLAKDASALYHVSSDDPPCMIMHGDQDSSVPLSQSTRFATALEHAGVPVQMEILSGAGHGGALFQETHSREIIRKFLQKHLK